MNEGIGRGWQFGFPMMKRVELPDQPAFSLTRPPIDIRRPRLLLSLPVGEC
jgi:hypothetical protein